jgi:hypothetical protein
MKYLVEVIPESIKDFDTAVSKLATTLKLDPAKASALLKRNPITKPVSQAEAEKVARLFTKAGIEVFIRSEEETSKAAVQSHTPQSSPPTSEAKVINVGAPFKEDALTASSTQPVSRAEPVLPPTPSVDDHQPERASETTRATVPPAVENQPIVDRQGAPESAKIPSLVPEIDQTSLGPTARGPAASFDIAQDITKGDDPYKVPSGFFTPVPESETKDIYGAATAANTFTPAPTNETRRARGNLGRLFFASLLPGLLALAGVFTALYLLGPPFLRTEQRVAAQTTAVSLASSIAGWIGDVSLDNPVLSQQVQNVIATTRPDLQQNGIRFVLLTDAEGNQIAGWNNDTLGVPDAIVTAEAVNTQISNALSETVTTDANSSLVLNDERLELAAYPVRRGDSAVGTVVVGMNDQLMSRVQSPLITLLLAGVIPLVVGIFISLLIGRTHS